MELESVRGLKQQLFAQGVTRKMVTRRDLPLLAAAVASAVPAAPLPPVIALGIEGQAGNFKLAVRITAVTPGIQASLDAIKSAAKGEVSIRSVGRVVKQQLTTRVRPLQIGFSVGHVKITAGTMGCFVSSQLAGEAGDLILSNNHVLADENQAQLGDDIVQPGPIDGGQAPADVVASLTRFVPLTASPAKNTIDAAVALVTTGIGVDAQTLQGLGALAGVRAAPLETGETVFKVGRTTGLTQGSVTATEMDDLTVGYDHLSNVIFDGQIEIGPAVAGQPFSMGGDSGSLIVDGQLQAVALLFAGNDVDATYANPIAAVLSGLQVQI
jgi:hypothetical protein